MQDINELIRQAYQMGINDTLNKDIDFARLEQLTRKPIEPNSLDDLSMVCQFALFNFLYSEKRLDDVCCSILESIPKVVSIYRNALALDEYLKLTPNDRVYLYNYLHYYTIIYDMDKINKTDCVLNIHSVFGSDKQKLCSLLIEQVPTGSIKEYTIKPQN